MAESYAGIKHTNGYSVHIDGVKLHHLDGLRLMKKEWLTDRECAVQRLDELDSDLCRLEDVLHGIEGNIVTSARKRLAEWMKELKQ